MSTFTLENEAFAGLVFYGGLCLAKTTAMSTVTAVYRFAKGSFPSAEDAKVLTKDPEKRKRLLQPNEEVERTRSVHRNDLENVVPFVLLGLLYISTNPPAATALTHFKLFTGFRFLHSFCYLIPLPQPSRVLSFTGGYLVTLSMLYRVLTA
uniref:Microsomal glutathione S-transferase 1 n=1 Tax=Ciona savignyi TaxID=51511 RepID=H2Y965_CIOSA